MFCRAAIVNIVSLNLGLNARTPVPVWINPNSFSANSRIDLVSAIFGNCISKAIPFKRNCYFSIWIFNNF
jgi:hypothetical protein